MKTDDENTSNIGQVALGQLSPNEKIVNGCLRIVRSKLGVRFEEQLIKNITKCYNYIDGDGNRIFVYGIEVDKGIPLFKREKEIERVGWVNEVDLDNIPNEYVDIINKCVEKIKSEQKTK